MKKLGDREKKYVHMLNATLCATGRAICCLLETYQVRVLSVRAICLYVYLRFTSFLHYGVLVAHTLVCVQTRSVALCEVFVVSPVPRYWHRLILGTHTDLSFMFMQYTTL